MDSNSSQPEPACRREGIEAAMRYLAACRPRKYKLVSDQTGLTLIDTAEKVLFDINGKTRGLK